MKQTGKIFTWKNDDNGVPQENPLKNTFFYFKQGNVRKATMQTNEKGEFSFDLPLGSYTIQISQGASFEILDLFAGVPFELLSTNSETTFNDWFMNPVTANPNENPLVVRLQQLAKIATDAATEVQQIQQDLANKGYYHPTNTRKDKNNVLHATTGTPRDTLLVGDLGLGNALRFSQTDNVTNLASHALGSSFRWCVNIVGRPDNSHNGNVIVTRENDNYGNILYQDLNGNLFSNTVFGGVVKGWKKLYSENNTTVDSNGFVKSASPIIKLFNDKVECSGFKEKPMFEKLSIGVYKISNTHGLARNGWTYEKPRGKDGNTYFMIKVEKLDNGCIISVHDYFVDYEDVEIIDDSGNTRTVKKQIEVLSQARDIKPHERWIDLRFHEQIYSLTSELPELNVPYRELWGIEPYIPPVVEQIEEDIALENQRAF